MCLSCDQHLFESLNDPYFNLPICRFCLVNINRSLTFARPSELRRHIREGRDIPDHVVVSDPMKTIVIGAMPKKKQTWKRPPERVRKTRGQR